MGLSAVKKKHEELLSRAQAKSQELLRMAECDAQRTAMVNLERLILRDDDALIAPDILPLLQAELAKIGLNAWGG